jgi:hypothetical protein
MRGSTTAAGHEENLELPLKERMSWVGDHYIVMISMRSTNAFLVPKWGINS